MQGIELAQVSEEFFKNIILLYNLPHKINDQINNEGKVPGGLAKTLSRNLNHCA